MTFVDDSGLGGEPPLGDLDLGPAASPRPDRRQRASEPEPLFEQRSPFPVVAAHCSAETNVACSRSGCRIAKWIASPTMSAVVFGLGFSSASFT